MATEKIQAVLEKNSVFASSNFVAPPDMKVLTSTTPRNSIVAIVSCSDPRVIPEHFFKLDPLEAPIIRAAGGRAKKALDSLLVLENLLGLGGILVIQHTDCGMTHKTDAGLKQAFKDKCPDKADELDKLEFGAITEGVEATVKSDVAYLKSLPYFDKNLKVQGAIYDTFTGKVSLVA